MSYVQACMPAVADVVSGSVPRPRGRLPGESLHAWLVLTPVYRALDLDVDGLLVCSVDADLVDFLGDYCEVCLYDVRLSRVLCLNEDGTRVAVRDSVALASLMGGGL
jgi:hypothetical protein